MDFHQQMMKYAIELSKKGAGRCSPNPLVGAVIVKGDKIVAEGYHAGYGEIHAEAMALQELTEDPKECTLYVTFEPCCHYGKTPPCVPAILESGIKTIFIGTIDPNPRVSGKGIKILKDAGVEVHIGILEEEIKKLNEPFFKFIRTGLPFVLIKCAISLDGKIATFAGDSKWLSSPQTREFAHELRRNMDGVAVGIGTILADDPLLTCRLQRKEDSIDPHRYILDSTLRIPETAQVLHLNSPKRTILVTTEKAPPDKIKRLKNMGAEVMILPEWNGKVDFKVFVEELGREEITSLMIEGGEQLITNVIERRLADKLILCFAPKLIGGEKAKTFFAGKGVEKISEAYALKDIEINRIGDDIIYSGYFA